MTLLDAHRSHQKCKGRATEGERCLACLLDEIRSIVTSPMEKRKQTQEGKGVPPTRINTGKPSSLKASFTFPQLEVDSSYVWITTLERTEDPTASLFWLGSETQIMSWGWDEEMISKTSYWNMAMVMCGVQGRRGKWVGGNVCYNVGWI